MSAERWERIQRLVEEALERAPAQQRPFLESACGGDDALRDEVLSLLHAPAIDELPTIWVRAMAAAEPLRFAAGDRLANRYVIHALLGRGGMGEVYEAQDEELDITVALKTLRLAGIEDEALDRLRLEGLLARAVWHPNVCRVYDLGFHAEQDARTWFLTMERLHGTTLADRMRERGRLPLDRAGRLADQMAKGLGAAHAAGVVHRDFKPGNVMLVERDGEEQAVITDFGTARAAATRDMAIIGTPAYMAPEQIRGEEIGPAADIHALGVALYEMVTGKLPFPDACSLEEAKRRLEDDAPAPRTVVPDLDERWNTAILRCLAREPRHRFARAEDVADALAGRLPAAFAEASVATSSTLPRERDSFVGRQADIEALQHEDARLVTLLGAGGMGKTRLAVRYGWQSLGTWPGGVWFCDLTEARDANGIVAAVAGSLGIPIGRGNPIQQIGHAVAGRGTCLLVLDNFERLTSHAWETVGRWMEHAREARWLVTSRERLHLDGERVHAVEPLTMAAGVELFETRARGLRPALALSGAEAEAAQEIVRLVDGMPLAIELAAARMRVMSAAQIAAQMRKRFQLLTGGTSARHETLEGVIEGSWELLQPWERSAWAQCSVFDGGFTLEAAETVVDLGAWPDAPAWIDVVRSLTDKSLLRTWVPVARAGEALPEARFGMYATLQEFARMKLHEPSAEERHGRWYARYGTDEAIEALSRHGGAARRQRLGHEIDNLTAACRRALERRDGSTATHAYRATVEVVFLRGPFGAAVQLGRDLLAGLSLDPKDEADVLLALGTVERLSGRMEDARSDWERALGAARDAGERAVEGVVLGSLGILHAEQGRMDEARAHFEAALAIHLESGDRRWQGVFTGYLGGVALDQGRMEEARARMEAALAIHRELGNRRFEGLVLGNLAKLHREQGRLDEAMSHNEQALAIHRETGDRRLEGVMLGQMGNVQVNRGRLEDGRSCYEAALAIFHELGAKPLEANYLSSLAIAFRQMGRSDEARSHLETALAIHRQHGDFLAEGIAHDNLGGLLLEQDRVEEAREALTKGERVYRRIGASIELGMLLCTRAALERRVGDLAAARVALAEAQSIAEQVGAGPDSELRRLLARARSAADDEATKRSQHAEL